MVDNPSTDARGRLGKNQKNKRGVRFGVGTLLMIVTLVATLIASETNRIRHRRIIERSYKWDLERSMLYTPRFEKLDANGFAATTLTKLLGARWNEVVYSVHISNHEMNDGVFDSVTELRHLRALSFSRIDLTESQYDQLAKMRSLQWLLLVNTNIDLPTLEKLRDALPNTFVNAFAVGPYSEKHPEKSEPLERALR